MNNTTMPSKHSTKKRTKFVKFDEFIKTTLPCKNGKNCTKEGCVFLHNIKTRMCKFGANCKRKQCDFAHNDKELYIPNCKFGMKCVNSKCTFKHPEKIEWNVDEKPEELNDLQNAVKNSTNFPITIKSVGKKNSCINYSEMKHIIEDTDTVIIEDKDLKSMIEKYDCILNYKEVVFKLQ